MEVELRLNDSEMGQHGLFIILFLTILHTGARSQTAAELRLSLLADGCDTDVDAENFYKERRNDSRYYYGVSAEQQLPSK